MPEFKGRLRTPRLAGAPATPITGEMYFDTTANKLYWWNGTVWVDATGPFAPAAHASTHQPGGSDAMPVDAAVGVGSLRTLASGSTAGQKAMPGNASLDEMVPPRSVVDFNFQRITNLNDPAGNGDAATKGYTDSLVAGASEINVSPAGPSPRVGELLWVDTDDQSGGGTFPPKADVSFGGYKATLLGNPTNPQDAATKQYVDNARGQAGQTVVNAGPNYYASGAQITAVTLSGVRSGSRVICTLSGYLQNNGTNGTSYSQVLQVRRLVASVVQEAKHISVVASSVNGQYLPHPTSAMWTGLAAGDHTFQLWCATGTTATIGLYGWQFSALEVL